LGFESKNLLFAVFGGYFSPWIQIRGSAIFPDPGSQNLKDPTDPDSDPDPKHCLKLLS